MKKCCVLWAFALCVTMGLVSSAVESADQPGRTTWARAPVTVAVAATVAADEATPALAVTKFREGPTRKQRREAGATFGNVRRLLRDMQNSGVDLSSYTAAELSIEVGNQLMGENPKAFADPEFNWEGFLAFLERLIPLIMTFIGLFSSLTGIPCGLV